MDVVTAIMFGVLAIVFEHVLVEFAKDVHDFRREFPTKDKWQWDD